jgi:phasin family protein
MKGHDMTKAKSAGEKATGTAESALENGAEALKAGLEKALKNYDAILGFGKETAEACVKSATVAGKRVESLNNELYTYSRQSIDDAIAATKAVMGSKSVHEAFEFQTDFAKSAFESYVGQLSRVSEMVTEATKETYAPLKGRMQAWLDVVQTSRVV